MENPVNILIISKESSFFNTRKHRWEGFFLKMKYSVKNTNPVN